MAIVGTLIILFLVDKTIGLRFPKITKSRGLISRNMARKATIGKFRLNFTLTASERIETTR